MAMSIDKSNFRWMGRQRLLILGSILLITPLGFYTKFHTGLAAQMINNHLGGTCYVIFWSLLVYLFFPARRPYMIAAVVLAVTCCVEFTQLIDHNLLDMVKSTFIGSTLLGNTFSWFDFPWYFLGAVIGGVWMRRLAGYRD
jgi:hypothetical protein